MTRTWGMELARYGIRAVAIAPGLTATEMAQAMPEEARERSPSAIPLRRMAEPAEVSLAVRFALENDYINGRVIPVDGGLQALRTPAAPRAGAARRSHRRAAASRTTTAGDNGG